MMVDGILISLGVLVLSLFVGVGIGLGLGLGMEVAMRLSGDGRAVLLTWARARNTGEGRDDA